MADLIHISSEEFMQRVEFDTNGGCWLYTGHDGPTGYGRVRVPRTDGTAFQTMAHRYSYKLYVGPVPDDLVVCHKCDVRRCVNPKHLFIGTIADNNRDRDQKGRQARLAGTLNGCAKLTEDDIRVIRTLKGRFTHSVIAKHFGVGYSTISRIQTRTGWRHI